MIFWSLLQIINYTPTNFKIRSTQKLYARTTARKKSFAEQLVESTSQNHSKKTLVAIKDFINIVRFHQRDRFVFKQTAVIGSRLLEKKDKCQRVSHPKGSDA